MKPSILFLIMIFPLFTFGQQLPPFKVNAIEVKGLISAQTEKMKRAANIFEKVMNDTDFKKEFETKTFKSDRNDDLIQNPTAKQVIEKIYAASEHYKTESNNTADIYWYAEKKSFGERLADRKCKNIGYGYPSRKEIYTYTCLIDDKNSMAKLVGHIAHEWSHKLGFEHKKDWHSERDLTVPYTFGDLVAEYAKKYI